MPGNPSNHLQRWGAELCQAATLEGALQPLWMVHSMGWAVERPQLFAWLFMGAGVKLRNVDFSLTPIAKGELP